MAKQKSNQLISLSEIASSTPYSAEYLRLRILQGKLKGEKIGRNWFTKQSWVDDYLQKYASAENTVQPAAALSFAPTYVSARPIAAPSQTGGGEVMRTVPLDDLLALIAYPRAELIQALETGLLNGLKIGEQWYTRRDWLSSYIAEYSVKPEVTVKSYELKVNSYEKEKEVAPVFVPQPVVREAEPVVAPVIKPVFTPAPVQTPAIASEPEPEISSSKLVVGNRNWKLEIGRFLSQQISNFQQLISSKLFQRTAASLVVVALLFVTLSNNNVRASFADWSVKVASTTRAVASQTLRSLSATVATVAKAAGEGGHLITTKTQQALVITQDSVSTLLANVSNYRTSEILKFRTTLASISLPDISLPQISIPDVNLPDFNLPRLALPDVTMPHISIPDINLPDFSLSPITDNLANGFSAINKQARLIGEQITKNLARGEAFVNSSLGQMNLELVPKRIVANLQNLSLRAKRSNPVADSGIASVAGTLPRNDNGLVLGEAVTRTDIPVSSSPNFLSQSVTAFSQSFKDIVSFLNPSSPDSLLSRLSGTASEIGSALGTQADPLTRAASTVTTFFSQINPGKILQPAGSFIARLKPSTPSSPSAEATGDLRPTPDTTVSGELALQPAANLTPEQSPESASSADLLAKAVQPTAPAPIRYTQPLQNRPLTPSLVKEGAPASGSLTVSTPTGYLSLTNDGLLTTAKTIHTLSGLISDNFLQTKNLTVTDNANINKLTIASTLSSPEAIFTNLTVSNNATIGNLTVTGSFNPQSLTTSSLAADYISTKTITATGSLSGSSFSGQFGSFTNLASNSASFGGNNNDTFLSKSPSTFESTLSVTGAATLASTLALTGAATLSSTLAVTGASTLTGNTTIGGTLAVTGASTFTGALTANGGIALTGALTTSATSTALAFVASSATATSTLAGNLQVNGSLTNNSLLTTNYFSATSTSATSTFSTGGLAIGTNQFVVQQTSGYIGIATSTPAYLADINGAFRVGIQGGTSDYLLFANTTTNRVGIGTSTPGALFAITGNSLFDGSLSTFGQLTASYFSATSTTATSTFAFNIGSSSGNFTLQSDGTTNNILMQPYGGNVGIGTTTPGALFAVAGNALFDGSLSTFGQLTANYLTATSTTATSTIATGGFTVGTNQLVVQQTSGNIGIGTSTPSALLHLAKLSGSSDYTGLILENTSPVGYGAIIQFKNSYNTANHVLANIFAQSNGLLDSGDLFFQTSNSAGTVATAMTIANSGYVGVGTTTPWGKLSVEQGTEAGSFIIGNQGSSTPSFYVSGVNQDGRVGIGTSTPSALLTVQEDNATGHIVYFTDANTNTPAFRIAATSGDIETRGDFTQGARKDLATLANINDVFIYDTTKDVDGGQWRVDSSAQSSSWYNETLDATAQSCNISSNDRCGRKEFPEKAVLAATTSNLYIFDAKDNSMWMRFDDVTNTNMLRGGVTSSAVFGLNGKIYLTHAGNGYSLAVVNFIKDEGYTVSNPASQSQYYKGSVDDRNATSGFGATVGYDIVEDTVNDVHAAVINGKTYVAVATDGGVSLINETDKAVIDFTYTTNYDADNVWLTSGGEMYISFDDSGGQNRNLLAMYDVHRQTADVDISIGTNDNGYYNDMVAATGDLNRVGSDQDIFDIFVTEGTSFIDGISNTIYAGNSTGLSRISEKQGDESNGAVKYYQTATTTEEMIGDIRGMWPFSDSTQTNPNDASVKANTLTGANISSDDYVTGVRGTAIDFDGSSEYLNILDDADLSFPSNAPMSMGVWINADTIVGSDDIITKYDATTGAGAREYDFYLGNGSPYVDFYDETNDDYMRLNTTAVTAGAWNHIVVTYNGGTKTDSVAIYVNGVVSPTTIVWTPTTFSSMRDTAADFSIGVEETTDGSKVGYFDGKIDEPFITATVLTPAQIKYMYDVGKKALENHTAGKITGISGADSYQQLYGTSNIVKSVSVDLENNLMYVATNDGSNGGGVSAIGLLSDTIEDIWGSDALKTDDDGTAWNADDIVSVSVSGRYPRTLVIGTDTELWQETESFSLDKYRSQSQNPHGEHLVQTNLTVNQDLAVGNSFTVYGKVLGASTSGRDVACNVSTGCKPTFMVSSDGTVSVRDDLVLSGHTNLTSISSINDVYVYDTTKDTDGGAWTNDSNAKATSWYNEPIDATSQTCDIINNDRCGNRAFPQKAVIVGVNGAASGGMVYIFDAKDNSLWMRFDGGGTNLLTGVANRNISSVFALNGHIYLGLSGSSAAGVIEVDFINDKGYKIYDKTEGLATYSGNIANRNAASSNTWVSTSWKTIINITVNDVSAAVINGKTYVAVATDGGVSVINETDGTVAHIDAGVATNDIDAVQLTSDGKLYFIKNSATSGLLDSYYIFDRFGEQYISSRIAYYRSDTTPAAFTAAKTDGQITDLFVTEGTSFVDDKSNTIYLTHTEGLAKISEKQGDETNGAVKYYTQDYITEEMVGDIRGMWTFSEDNMLEDVSVKTNDLTSVNLTSADLVTGVRGTALDFDGSSEAGTVSSFTLPDAVTMGAWIKTDNDALANQCIMGTADANGDNDYCFIYDGSTDELYLQFYKDGSNYKYFKSTANLVAGIWYHVALTQSSPTEQPMFYLNGVGSQGRVTINTGTPSHSSTTWAIGRRGAESAYYFDGTIDEPFVTAEALTLAQIKYMYETGKRALEQKALSTTSDATAYGNDRIGDNGLAVTADDYIGSFIEINGGTGIGQTRRIVDNDTTTFYVDPPFDITPDTTSDFQILANQIYIKDSSTATTTQAVYVDKDAGVMYVGVNNGDNTGGVTAIGLDSDNILDIWHNQSGKTDDLGNVWNADDVVAISAASDGDGRDALRASPGNGGSAGDAFNASLPGILSIGTDAELWAQSAGQTLNALTSAGTSPTKNVLIVKDQATFQGKFKITDGESQSILSIDESSKNLNIREGIEFGSNTKLTNLSGINDVYVYDTSKDSDGGEWTCNDIARNTSWYNEALNTSTRGKTKCFPRKAILVITNSYFYIYDAKDNSKWMQFNVDSVSGLIRATTPILTSAYALNGTMYTSQTSAANTEIGLFAINFKDEKTTQYYYTDANPASIYKGNIAQRNSASGWYWLPTSTFHLVDARVNDVHAAVINGKTYVAVATNGGVTVINETDGTKVNLDGTGSDRFSRKIFISTDGKLYTEWSFTGGPTTYSSLNVKNDVTAITDDTGATNTWFNANYISASNPSVHLDWAASPYNLITSLYVTTGTSQIDGKSNTIFIGSTAGGLDVVQEKVGDETNGSVKYYTKDYISEEMVGDIRGMWGFGQYGQTASISDYSVKANTLTGNSIAASNYVAGVRGWALDFDGSADYLSRTDDADFTFVAGTPFSVGAWIKADAISAYDGIITKWDNGTANREWLFRFGASSDFEFRLLDESVVVSRGRSTTATLSTGQWYYVVGTHDGSGSDPNGGTKIYLNGVRMDTTNISTDGTYASMEDLTGPLEIGNISTDTGRQFDGIIDEPFVTAEELTPAQIKRMYEIGKRALEGGTEGVASSATSAHSAFRVGVAAGAVKYSAGQFIGSIIQVYDGPGSVTSTRFITQTASSTADYYVQFSPDHSATIADNDTFSIGPNSLQGSSNRVTAIAVDEYADFIYIGTTSNTGTSGMVTKIALDSDTVTDVWHPTIGKTDDYKQPFVTASTTAISIMDNTLAIGANDTNSGGFWSETGAESLDRKLTKPKTVFTVIDNIQTPRISAVTGALTISTGISYGTTTLGYASSTSLTIGTATTTLNTIQIKAGPSQNLLLSGDTNDGIYISSAGRVGIGTTNPSGALTIAKQVSGATILDLLYSADDASAPYIRTTKTRGTQSSQTAVLSGDSLALAPAVMGRGASSNYYAGYLQWVTTENWTNSAQGTELRFWVTKTGTTGVNQAMTINGSGNVGIGDSTPTEGNLVVYDSPAAAANIAYFFNDGGTVNDQGVVIQVGTDDNSGTNYHLILKDGDGTDVGYVTSSSGTVTYGAFTANHDVSIPEKYNAAGYAYGTLLCIDRLYNKDNLERGIMYETSACTGSYAKNIIGSYASKYQDKPNLHQTYILGDGHVLVNGEGGDIKVGDPIVSSSAEGIGMKAGRSGLSIGVAQENYSFKSKNEVYLMPVQYGLRYWYDESFVPIFDGKIDAVVQRVTKIEERLEVLEKKVGN